MFKESAMKRNTCCFIGNRAINETKELKAELVEPGVMVNRVLLDFLFQFFKCFGVEKVVKGYF